MADFIYIGITVGFFAVAIGYVRACRKLQGGAREWHGLARCRHALAARLPDVRAARAGEVL